MFPAYNKQSNQEEGARNNDDWLMNSSFQASAASSDSPQASASAQTNGNSCTALPNRQCSATKETTSREISPPFCGTPSVTNPVTKKFDNEESDIHLSKDDKNERGLMVVHEKESLSRRTVNEKIQTVYINSSSSDTDISSDEDSRKNVGKEEGGKQRRRYSSSSSSRDKSKELSKKYEKKKVTEHYRRRRSADRKKRAGSRHRKRSRSGSRSSDSSRGRNSSRHKNKKKQLSSSDSSSSEDRERRRRRSRSKDRSRRRSRSKERSRKRSRSRDCKKTETEKKKGERNKNDQETKKTSSELFYEDREKDVNNLLVSKLSRPIAAFRFIRYPILGLSKKPFSSRKKDKRNRYFEVLRDPAKRAELFGEAGDSRNAETLEEERSTRTAYFNQALAEDPSDVKLWLDYIDFQDTMRIKRHYSGGDPVGDAADPGREVRKIDRPTVEKKLAIVEKALESNPDSEELLDRRCRYAQIVLPDGQYREELNKWAVKDPSRIALWRALLFNSQSSLSACRASAVCKIGANAMEQLHAVRRAKRATTTEIAEIEDKILTVLLDLGLFLRQAGLSELLWSLLSLYLELNLARLEKDKFTISSYVQEKDLRDLEDAVLSSEMPLPTLWVRVETLRAGVHWLSLGVEEDCEDPQRMVLPEDTADLVQPVTTTSLHMRLVLVVLSLLKVPLLPWRDSTHRAVGLHDVPWALDGPEPLLAAVFRTGTFEARRAAAALLDSIQIASGAQYLATRPGQDQYIEFLSSVLLACADCLPAADQTAIHVWWLRFCRFLLQLDAWKLFVLPRGRAKKLRSTAKDLLKKEQNRNNVALFCEFALLEREIGGLEPACKVLRGALSVLPTHSPIPALGDRGPVCALYRTLADLLIISNEREKAKGALASVAIGGLLKEESPPASLVEKALSKFHHVSTELFVEVESLAEKGDGADDGSIYTFHLSFDFFVEWLTCHAWLLFLSDSVWKAVGMLENAISAIPSHARLVASRREALWEVYGHVLGLHCRDTCGSYGVLRDAVLRGLKDFPANMTLLGILCDIETSDIGCGLPQWQLSRSLCDIKSPAAHAFLVFLIRFRVENREGSGGLRRMTTLLRRLTRSLNPHCPLLWRIYLQLVSAVGDDKTLKNTWYLALEGCPWVKALYMDAVQSMPSELGRIQDLLQEKELRLHVTPEELEILRGD